MTQEPLKAAVSVAEMARMVGLSPQRFQQLKKEGVFPWPVYSLANRRPIYTEEQQELCITVRRRNFGINNKAVLFYAMRAPKQRAAKAKDQGRHSDLIATLKALGLTKVTAAQVDLALRATYPNGIAGVDEGEVVRALFLHLRRQNSGDNVGR